MSFVDFARANGVLIEHLRADGLVHRVPTTEHPRSRNGAYRFAGDWGWVQAWDLYDAPVVYRSDSRAAPAIPRRISSILLAQQRRQARAAREAQEIVARARLGTHAYLARKGFPAAQTLVAEDGRMVVPMRPHDDYRRVASVQFIDDVGDKKFLTGGAAKGAVFYLGSGPESWLCEGYATGLSVRAALASLYRRARVVVCFSAGNLAHVVAKLGGRCYVAADHDASGTGERAARATGLPWVMPPTQGTDFNDLHLAAGVRAVAERLREVFDG